MKESRKRVVKEPISPSQRGSLATSKRLFDTPKEALWTCQIGSFAKRKEINDFEASNVLKVINDFNGKWRDVINRVSSMS